VSAASRIVLSRLRRPLGDLLQAYAVFVDGSRRGEIRRGQTLRFDVSPGEHRLHLEIEFCRSRELTLAVSPGEEVRLTCRARPPMLGWAVTSRDDYVVLEIAGAGPIDDEQVVKHDT
jgi:hypothetical protein